jgi:hypothetical protein
MRQAPQSSTMKREHMATPSARRTVRASSVWLGRLRARARLPMGPPAWGRASCAPRLPPAPLVAAGLRSRGACMHAVQDLMQITGVFQIALHTDSIAHEGYAHRMHTVLL